MNRVKIAAFFAALAVVALLAVPMAVAQLEGVTNLNGVHLSQSSFGTATPQLMVQNGGSGVSVEVRNSSATPVWSVGSDGAVTQSADSQFAGIVGHTPTSYTLTGSQTLTPTTTYYELAPAAVLTLTLTSGSAGDVLILANTVATSTVILDTGATVGGGNITLGANDIAAFIKVDDTWAELYSPDNS